MPSSTGVTGAAPFARRPRAGGTPAGRSVTAEEAGVLSPVPLAPARQAPGDQSPVWDPAPELTAAECAAAYDGTSAFTIGAEEELMLVDPVTLELAPSVTEAIAIVGDDSRFSPELRAAQLEIVTPVCRSAADAARQIADARRDLVRRLDGRFRIMSAGTHPTSTQWGEITEGDRYRKIADEYAWAATRSLMCGLHVHVAVQGADRALAVYNALRSYLPELAALAANSPYLEGRDTEMCSIRPKLNEFFPRAGVPPAFASWDEMVAFTEWGRRGGLFPDWTHFWWDLRPSPAHGTIELRVLDAQTRVRDTAGLLALVQALVVALAERFDAGERLPVHETHWINENAWRAHRYGTAGCLVDLETGRRVPAQERLAEMVEQLEPHAARMGAARELGLARRLVDGIGADRQREIAAAGGLDALVRALVDETEQCLDV